MKIEVFSDVEPNPSTNTVYAGTKMMVDFQPDTVIALGGGSAMDAAKGMWMFYEHRYRVLWCKTKFLDIRKRTYKIAKPEKHNLFVSQLLQELVQKLHHLPLLLIVKHT